MRRRIAFLGSATPAHPGLLIRLLGYRRGHEAAGINVNQALPFAALTSEEAGAQAAG